MDISAGVRGTFRGITGEASASASQSDSSAISSQLGTSTLIWKRRGGDATGDFDTWKTTIDNQPAPVKVALEPLTSLVSSSAQNAALQSAIARHVAAAKANGFFNQPTVSGSANLQDRGTVTYDTGGFMGTRGQGRRLEAFRLTMFPLVGEMRLRYMAHLADYGDTAWISEGELVGTTGEGRQLQGFAVQLYPPSPDFDVQYMAHLSNDGDTGWASNGAMVGGAGKNVEGMEVRVMPKAVS